MSESRPSFDPTRDVSFVVISCDKYRDLWGPFFGCLTKYWPDCPFPVFLVTNEAPYPREGVSVVHVGPDRDYANNLITALRSIHTPWLVLWVEDALITGPVDTPRLLTMLKDAVAYGAGYLKLTPDAPLSFDDSNGELIGPIPKGVRYRSAIGAALYRKDTLLKLLVPGCSAWELDKSGRSDQLSEAFMAMTVREARRPPIPAINAVIKGEWYRPVVAFLKAEGFGEILRGRRRQSWARFLYIKAYLSRIALFRIARRHWYD